MSHLAPHAAKAPPKKTRTAEATSSEVRRQLSSLVWVSPCSAQQDALGRLDPKVLRWLKGSLRRK